MPQMPFEQLKDYENKWIALLESNQEVVGSGTDAVEATEDAKRHGHKQVTLFYVPWFDSYFIRPGHGVGTHALAHSGQGALVRDVTFDEDRSQVRMDSIPQVMAALQNTAIWLMRVAGETNIAAARQRFAAQRWSALPFCRVRLCGKTRSAHERRCHTASDTIMRPNHRRAIHVQPPA